MDVLVKLNQKPLMFSMNGRVQFLAFTFNSGNIESTEGLVQASNKMQKSPQCLFAVLLKAVAGLLPV